MRLSRQAQILAREGVTTDHSTLAQSVDFAAFELKPLDARLSQIIKALTKVLVDETGCPRLLSGLPQFVTVRGGAYFFLPGLRGLKMILGA